MKIITYNIDGLPETLDLNNLPWVFKPLVWIYKLFAKTTIIHLNDNPGRAESTKKISHYLKDFDIAVFQEDFNYHDELTSELKDRNWGTFQGAIDLSKVFSMVKWFRYKADGLGMMTTPQISIVDEDMVEWNNSCGYFSHCNDKLTRKGFRRYVLMVTQTGQHFVVYALHADASADLEDVRDSDTRRKQFTQLVDYIRDDKYTSYVNIPIIILGDTNCTQLDIDKTTINDYLMAPLQDIGFNVEEAQPNDDIDRAFVANRTDSTNKMVINGCEHGVSGLSDHRPFIMDFDIVSC